MLVRGAITVSASSRFRLRVIFPNAQVARRGATARVRLRRFKEDQSSPADREPPKIDQVPIRGESIDTLIHQHGRDDNPITKGQLAYLKRGKQ